jgi:hypothetical protein
MKPLSAASRPVRLFSGPVLAALGVLLIGSPSAVGQGLAIQPRFDAAGVFHRGAAPVRIDGRWGLIGRQAEWILKPTYDQIGPGGESLFPFQQDGKWGYLDNAGTPRISALYDEAQPFDDGVAPVKSKDAWGLLRPDGSLAVDFRFDEIGGHRGEYVSARDSEGWAVFQNAGTTDEYRHKLSVNIVDQNGVQAPTPPDRLYSISEGAVVAAYTDGERLIELADYSKIDELPSYVSVRRRSEGLAAVAWAKDEWSFIDKAGYPWRHGVYQDAMIFSEGLSPVKLEGRWGYLATSGELEVTPAYDAAYPVRDGYAIVRVGDKRGFLKHDIERGLIAFIDPQYDDASRFSEGLAPVKIGDKWGYVADRSGLVIEGGIIEVTPE